MARTPKIWIVTLFPDYFTPFFSQGVASQAFKGERGRAFQIHVLNLRDFTTQKYKGVDDMPFGGGPGMIMRPDVLKSALFDGVIQPGNYGENYKSLLTVVYTSARGRKWDLQFSKEFARDYYGDQGKDLVFICGRYEGIDERFIEKYVDLEINIGDYILTGGELAVLSILDSSVRFVPGTLGNAEGLITESFEDGLLEGPQYTRPQIFDEMNIPEILLSGHHAKIKDFQTKERERITKKFRPDLLKKR